MPSRSAYAKAGVDIQLGNQVKGDASILISLNPSPRGIG